MRLSSYLLESAFLKIRTNARLSSWKGKCLFYKVKISWRRKTPLMPLRIFTVVQKMYLEEAHEECQGAYLAWAARSLTENPSFASHLELADQLVASRQYYKALRSLKKLIGPEAFKMDRNPPENYIPRINGWKKAL